MRKLTNLLNNLKKR